MTRHKALAIFDRVFEAKEIEPGWWKLAGLDLVDMGERREEWVVCKGDGEWVYRIHPKGPMRRYRDVHTAIEAVRLLYANLFYNVVILEKEREKRNAKT